MSRDDSLATTCDAPASSKEPLLTRRRVLLAGGVVAGAGLVGAGLLTYDLRERYASSAATIRDHRVKVAGSTPRMVIVRGPDPQRNVKAGLARLGGMKAFVSKGDIVLIKPNAGWDRVPAQAGNTDPDVVASLVAACRRAGAKRVIVTDCPVHEAPRTFKRSGIEKAARQAGAEVILPSKAESPKVKLSRRLGNWPVLEPFVLADKIINVPIVKHHGSALVTAGMKNWIGITEHQRSRFHSDLNRTIAELSLAMRPTLTVVDAHRILVRNGPQGGNLDDVRQENALALSLDPVAVDAWACDLLGTSHSKVGYLKLAQDMGLGVVNYKSIKPVEIEA